jgi:hypothetical protein
MRTHSELCLGWRRQQISSSKGEKSKNGWREYQASYIPFVYNSAFHLQLAGNFISWCLVWKKIELFLFFQVIGV